VRQVPIIGTIATMFGAVFVSRNKSTTTNNGSRTSAAIVNRQMRFTYRNCYTVLVIVINLYIYCFLYKASNGVAPLVIFPEGTTSNGNYLCNRRAINFYIAHTRTHRYCSTFSFKCFYCRTSYSTSCHLVTSKYIYTFHSSIF
jgi:1-acyl-sn-glycerol-3-phosphate acyltransferase